MQIIIEISEMQKKMVDALMELPPLVENDLISAIRHGTILPKHYGRLIDADAYIDKHAECGWLDDLTVDEFNKITPTIIPATENEFFNFDAPIIKKQTATKEVQDDTRRSKSDT